MEHVVLTVTILSLSSSSYRGETTIGLYSPNGTLSLLLYPREPDRDTNDGFVNWQFTSVHFWGEDPVGAWTLVVLHDSFSGVSVRDISLTLYGTAAVPAAVARIPSQCDPACATAVDGCAGPGEELCDACRVYRDASSLRCINTCPAQFALRSGYCYDPALPEPTCQREYPPDTAIRAGALSAVPLVLLAVISLLVT